jgi:hypothetical protein
MLCPQTKEESEMNNFKITGPGEYKDREGRKCWIIGEHPKLIGLFVGVSHDSDVLTFNEMGDCRFGTVARVTTPLDIVAEWTEPKTWELDRWCCIGYSANSAEPFILGSFPSLEEAQKRAKHMAYVKAIINIKRTIAEGEGLPQASEE